MLKDLNIFKKLILGFGIVIVLTVFLGLSSIYYMRELSGFTTRLYNNPYAVVTSLREANTNIVAIHRSMKDVALARTPADIDKALASIAANEKIIAEKLDLVRQRYLGDQREIAAVNAALEDWAATRRQTVALSKAGDMERAARLTQSEGNRKLEKVNQSMETIISFAQNSADHFYANAVEVQGRVIAIIVGILAAVVIVSVAVGWAISRGLTAGINNLLDICVKIADGDLKERVRVSGKDEIGRLGEATNHMIDNLRALLSQIQRTSTQLASSSEEMTASADQSSAATQNVVRSITDVSELSMKQAEAIDSSTHIIEQISLGIEKTAATIGNETNQANQAVIAAREGNETIDGAVRQMHQLEKTVNESAQVVEKLGQRSKEIDQIVETITGIAGQTNLLALNAAIEAARAGEMGKGFAVVAEEVRKLAEQSQDAAKKIGVLIREVQGDTEEAVAAMNNGTQGVREGTAAVSEAGKSFEDILRMINAVNQQSSDISSTMEELAKNTQEVVGVVRAIDASSKDMSSKAQTVSAATEEQSASMEQIAGASRNLAELAEELRQATVRFRL